MEYLNLIEKYKEDMLEMLQKLIAIKSVAAPGITSKDEPVAEGRLPFGEEVHKAFKFMLEAAQNDGFEVENTDNYGGHIEFGGYSLDEEGNINHVSDEIMGILGHLDVVPEGSDWDCDPYGGEIKDGYIYGRGTTDDKGPVVAVYFAMKAMKDAGIIPAKKVRLILGLDEETNWAGMEYYLRKNKAPDFGFTPDAEFPAIHGEKGIVDFELAKKISKTSGKGLEIRSITGGNAANMVADSARCVLRGEKGYDEAREIIAAYKAEKKYSINVKGIGKSLEIVTHGISAHGARPHLGLNAISIMMELLDRIPFINDDMREFVDFYNTNIGFEVDGTAMGCGFFDEPSGKLSFNVGIIEVDSEIARLVINARYPVTMKEEDVYNGILPITNKHNMGIIKLKNQEPIYIPADDPMIKTLMEVYREHTGDKDSQPIVIGGGTYARAARNVVAFGASFPGEPELAHQKNERISIENLIKCAKIYGETIYRLTLED